MKIESKVNIVELLTLFLALIGGIFGYYFVNIHKVEESDANTKLAKIQTSVANIEAKYKGTLLKLEAKSNNVTLTVNISDFLANIQPNVKIFLQPHFKYGDNILYLTWNLTNIGKYAAVIDSPTILLSTVGVSDEQNSSELLKKGIDYKFLSTSFVLGGLPPGQTVEYDMTIKLLRPIKVDRIYQVTSWKTKTWGPIRELTKEILGSRFDEDHLNKLTSMNYTQQGWLNLRYGER